MSKEKTYEKIEAYLDDELSSSDKLAFEKEIAEDSNLRNEVDLHKSLQSELSEDVLNLKEKLRNINSGAKETDKSSGKQAKILRLVMRSVAVAAILGLGIFFLPQLFNESIAPEGLYASYYEPYPMALNQRSADGSQETISLNEAVKNYTQKDYGKASIQFEELNKLEPDDVYLLYKANAEQAQGNLNEALNIYEGIIANGNEKYIQQAQWFKSLILINKGDLEEVKSFINSLSSEHYKSEELEQILKVLE